jgi:hypothetical protein
MTLTKEEPRTLNGYEAAQLVSSSQYSVFGYALNDGWASHHELAIAEITGGQAVAVGSYTVGVSSQSNRAKLSKGDDTGVRKYRLLFFASPRPIMLLVDCEDQRVPQTMATQQKKDFLGLMDMLKATANEELIRTPIVRKLH